MTTRRFVTHSYLALFALVMGIFAMCLGMRDASAQQVIIVNPQPQRVIVEHHYPQGVTYIPGNGGSRVIVQGGHVGPTTCYRECYHQGRTTVIHQGPVYVQPRSHFSFGFSAYDHRGSGVSFGVTEVR